MKRCLAVQILDERHIEELFLLTILIFFFRHGITQKLLEELKVTSDTMQYGVVIRQDVQAHGLHDIL